MAQKAIVIKNPKFAGEYGVYIQEGNRKRTLGQARVTALGTSVSWYVQTPNGLVHCGYEPNVESALCKIAWWHGMEVEL